MAMSWPPGLDELKADMGVPVEEDRDDDRLQQVLDAAIVYVQRIHECSFNFDESPEASPATDLPDVPDDIILGTLRLAGRWHTRRRSPDGLVEMSELGTSRIPFGDPDIERLLRIGRYRGAVFA